MAQIQKATFNKIDFPLNHFRIFQRGRKGLPLFRENPETDPFDSAHYLHIDEADGVMKSKRRKITAMGFSAKKYDGWKSIFEAIDNAKLVTEAPSTCEIFSTFQEYSGIFSEKFGVKNLDATTPFSSSTTAFSPRN